MFFVEFKHRNHIPLPSLRLPKKMPIEAVRVKTLHKVPNKLLDSLLIHSAPHSDLSFLPPLHRVLEVQWLED